MISYQSLLLSTIVLNDIWESTAKYLREKLLWLENECSQENFQLLLIMNAY